LKITEITAKFSKFIPEVLEDGILYVSLEYHTATHKCCCGCGEKVVTPLNDSWWKIEMNGELASLSPSIGSFSLECKSHYYIKESKIQWL